MEKVDFKEVVKEKQNGQNHKKVQELKERDVKY
jgi:hypothetical protein